jgi:CheY-like chemotaxis protein
LSLASAAASASASQRLAGIRLLVVEDNVNNQQIACELLEGEGASVTIAQHGQHALEILATDATAFDVVLMDLQMPVMDGLTATRHIRQDMGLQQLPIVAMTANVMQSDREACEAAGMNEHVGKPFDLQHLVTVLCKQVGRQLSLAPSSNPESSNAPVLVSRVSEAAAQAGVDLQQALQFMGGQQELYERLLPMFLENLVAIPAQLRELLAQGDTQSASRQLHTLKGLAGQMGVTALALEAVKGEKQLAGTPSPEQAAAAVEQACSAIMQASPGLIALQQAFVAEQACEAEAKLPTVAIDRPALRIALHALVQLLENSDMQALAAIGQLQGQFAPALNEPLSALARVINALDFSQALTLCTGLLEEHAA